MGICIYYCHEWNHENTDTPRCKHSNTISQPLFHMDMHGHRQKHTLVSLHGVHKNKLCQYVEICTSLTISKAVMLFLTRLTMYYIRVLLYDTVIVTVWFSHGFSTMCICVHRIWLRNYTNTVRILTNTLHRGTMTKSYSNSDNIVE